MGVEAAFLSRQRLLWTVERVSSRCRPQYPLGVCGHRPGIYLSLLCWEMLAPEATFQVLTVPAVISGDPSHSYTRSRGSRPS